MNVDNDPGDEWGGFDVKAWHRDVFAQMDREITEAIARMYGFIPEPEPMDSEEYIKTLRGAAGDVEQAIDSAPCDEHKASIRQAADLLRGMADETESVIKARG